jgi:hypothetical protein
VGVEFEARLVERIIDDVISAPGSLPMMQYTLTELFARRVDGVITGELYDRIGGINGAITARARVRRSAGRPRSAGTGLDSPTTSP